MSFVPKTISLGLGFGWDEAGTRMYLIISTSVILDLCFGEDGADALFDIPDMKVAAASVGLGVKSARRSRGLVADCLLSVQEDCPCARPMQIQILKLIEYLTELTERDCIVIFFC